MNIKVCIVEDHKGTRQGLELLIHHTPGFEVTGAFGNAVNIIRQAERCKPDVVLMDIQLPGISGIEAVRQLRQHFPAVKVVMQTVFEDDDKVFASICAGASGYILKNTPPLKFLEAIQEAYHGGAPMTGTIASRVLTMFKSMAAAPTPVGEQLSDREKEILTHLVNGHSYKQIAAICDITYDTVRFHMKNIYAKLHVSSMTEAVVKAIQQRLV
jgi:DNA-binding NarL/FixJ family response regulator